MYTTYMNMLYTKYFKLFQPILSNTEVFFLKLYVFRGLCVIKIENFRFQEEPFLTENK